jgi:cation diffusion facilitator family transporter
MKSESKTAIIAALAGNLAIALTKLVAAVITGSSAMLSETVHSLVDTGNELMLLYGLRQSQEPADREHPFGHGRELYFWALMVALAIFAVGAGVSLYQGVYRTLHPSPLENPFWNYLVLGIAFVFEGISWIFGWRAFRTSRGRRGVWEGLRLSKDPSSFLVFFEDSGALVGLVIAFLGIFLGQLLGLPRLDGIASIAIGVVLGLMSLFLANETKGLLIGEGFDRETTDRLRKIIEADPNTVRLDRILTLYLGPSEVMLTMDARFHTEFSVGELRQAMDTLKRTIRQEFPQITRIYFAAESMPDEGMAIDEAE